MFTCLDTIYEREVEGSGGLLDLLDINVCILKCRYQMNLEQKSIFNSTLLI